IPENLRANHRCHGSNEASSLHFHFSANSEAFPEQGRHGAKFTRQTREMTLKRNDTISESCVLSQVLVDQIRIRLIRGLIDDLEREESFQAPEERRGVFPLFCSLIRARRRGILKNAFGFHFAFRQPLAQLFQTIGRLAKYIPPSPLFFFSLL